MTVFYRSKAYWIFIFVFAFTCVFQTAFSSTLDSIEFLKVNDTSRLILSFDEIPRDILKKHNTDQKQIVIDLPETKANQKVIRPFDTSEFSGATVYIRPKPLETNPETLRVGIQLRDNVRSTLKKEGNKLVIDIEDRFGVFSLDQLQGEKQFSPKVKGRTVNVPKSKSLEDILRNLTLSGSKKYIGKKISFNVKNAQVSDLLKMIADISGFNIIFLTEDIKKLPSLSLKLTNVPWDQALDTILNINKLVASKNGPILMISTFEKAKKQKIDDIAAKKLAENEEPLVTKIFSINYAKTQDLTKIIAPYLTPVRGAVTEDPRTNALIVKDTIDNIDRVKTIIKILDTQTPQVLIEAKIVEVNESYAKEIGLKNGLNFGYDPIGTEGVSRANVGGAPGAAQVGGPGLQFSSAPSSGDGARNLLGLTIGRFNRIFDLSFQLQLMETESKGKIIASPKVVAKNNEKALIKTTDSTSYAVTRFEGAQQTETFEETEASLNLEVTPQVTSEGAVGLDISIKKEQFGLRPTGLPKGPPQKATREIQTKVLVDNGSTIVIGGIYSFQKTESHSGVPLLKNIPLLGWLFRSPYNPEVSKSEMVVFLTPRIVNQEEAGLN